MRKFVATAALSVALIIGIVATLICGSAAPALAADNPDGSTSWTITWIAEPGVKYNVHDSYTKMSTSVKCATGDTWDPNTTVYITAIPVNDYTIEFTAPEGAKTCVAYTLEPMATPAPAPSPSASTPAPNPTTTTPVPVPSVTTPTTKAETPKPSELGLATTGTNAEIAATLVIMIAAIGAVIYITSISRKESD